MASEIELKFQVSPGTAGKLRKARWLKSSAAPAKGFIKSVYFDTKSFKLRRHGVSVRVRNSGKRHVQTVKAEGESPAAGLAERGQWESEIDGAQPDWQAMQGTPLQQLLTKKTLRKLQPIFETRVHRTIIPVSTDHSQVEIALDQGRIRSGRKSRPICEIELELKRGKKSALFDLAQKTVAHVPARLDVESKADQGYALLGHPSPRRAEPVHLAPDLAAEQAFKIIAVSCIRHFARNTEGVLAGESEAIHQMRVGLRRLRAAISLFGDLLQGAETDAIKTDLKWMSGQLGRARDLDVLAHNDAIQAMHRTPGADVFRDRLAQRRMAAFAKAKRVVSSHRYSRDVLKVATWSETGDWTRGTSTRQSALRKQPIHELADDVLSRRAKKIWKKAAKLDSLDAHRRHRLRIAIKKLRYATDFFASVFPGKKAARRRAALTKTLSELQDCLGKLNDIAVHRALALEIARGARGRGRKAGNRALFAAGSLSGQEESESSPAMKQASKAARRLTRQSAFW